MAKFGRFDPRNKKRDRNKNISQSSRDTKIRDVEENKTGFKIKGHQIDYVMYDGQNETQSDEES
jgi:hypothetical protein